MKLLSNVKMSTMNKILTLQLFKRLILKAKTSQSIDLLSLHYK